MKTGHAARVAVMAVAFACWGLAGGCGSRSSILDETGAHAGGSGSGGSSMGSSASSSGTGSSSGSGPIADASTPDAGCDAQGLEVEVCQLLSSSEAYTFDRHVDLLDFFRHSALDSDPALCGGGTTIITCAYDPTTPRSGPADIHHSNALGEFVGPDGDPWIWDYLQPTNQWIAVDGNRSPTTCALVVEYATCFLEQDAGQGTILDASTESLCPQGTASCGAAESCLEALAGSSPDCGSPDWVFVFSREDDLIAYLQMVLQLDAAPVPLPGAQFVGANGHPYVYGWFQSLNRWFVIDGYHAPAAYQLGVEYDQCTSPDAAAD